MHVRIFSAAPTRGGGLLPRKKIGHTAHQCNPIMKYKPTGDTSVGPVASAFLDVLVAIAKPQNEDLGLADEHLNSCHPYATCLDQVTDAFSPELVMDVQTVVLQPDDEAEKPTVSDRDDLGNPMHASALVEVVHEIRSSSTELLVTGALAVELQCCKNDGPNYVSQGVSLDGVQVGWEPDQTLPQKPNDGGSTGPVAPTIVEEDQEDFSNLNLVALWMVLNSNASQAYLASLTPKGLQTINGLLDKCSSAESKALSTSSPRVVADQDSLPEKNLSAWGSVILLDGLGDWSSNCRWVSEVVEMGRPIESAVSLGCVGVFDMHSISLMVRIFGAQGLWYTRTMGCKSLEAYPGWLAWWESVFEVVRFGLLSSEQIYALVYWAAEVGGIWQVISFSGGSMGFCCWSSTALAEILFDVVSG
ncbi:hypothetical protein Nepgr_031800 [Nepenthes gracilis]|uniref:Uncharacterized protein n=1 Tax=Nepenthes gracilis TaxID=150966 RepID=A0AAD3TJH8_NEPGR|nr:hypothetical protein Nepgr_031800 [Nepenthes gracilis]